MVRLVQHFSFSPPLPMPFGLGAGLGVRPMLKRTASMVCSSDDPRSPKRPDFDTDKYFRSELPQDVHYPALAELPPLATFQPILPAPTLQPLEPIPELTLDVPEDPELKSEQRLVKPVATRRRREPPIPEDCYKYYYGGRACPFTIPKHTVIVPEGLVLSILRRLGSEPDRRW
jgi:hypothetical protein